MAHNGHGNGGTRNVKLEDLVSHSMIKKLEPVMNDIAQGKIDVSEGKKRLLKLLEAERRELNEKGVLADYLAWVLAASAAKSGGHLGSIQVK
jgi:hypothetical protein